MSQNAKLKHYIPDEAEMEAFGGRLARACNGRGVIYLEGDLGAGKTTLARGLLRSLGYTGHVKSPTYTLIEPYELAQATIYHLDLYRLASPEELEWLGFRDLTGADVLLLVEWPERAAGELPVPDLTVSLSFSGEGRELALTAHTPLGRRMADHLL